VEYREHGNQTPSFIKGGNCFERLSVSQGGLLSILFTIRVYTSFCSNLPDLTTFFSVVGTKSCFPRPLEVRGRWIGGVRGGTRKGSIYCKNYKHYFPASTLRSLVSSVMFLAYVEHTLIQFYFRNCKLIKYIFNYLYNRCIYIIESIYIYSLHISA
jgi:hypothetical protein